MRPGHSYDLKACLRDVKSRQNTSCEHTWIRASGDQERSGEDRPVILCPEDSRHASVQWSMGQTVL